jgi:hypothetical protein
MRATWRKSSHSGSDNGDCVELRNTLDAVRDSKNPGQALKVDLATFIDQVKADRFTG